jgi:hypothetical protein
MDSCDSTTAQKTEPSTSAPLNNSTSTSNVFQPSWVRRAIRSCYELDQLISRNRSYLLLRFNPLLLLILLFAEAREERAYT